jgi:translocation and assembly module TamB
VRAIRRGLAVEAGVEVIGTVARPEVRLISEPNVPDADKLSWMVLGRASDQMAGSEATLLMSAAGAIFGGDNGSNVPGNIARSLGLGDISFGTTGTSPESQMPVQTVAGSINNSAVNDQVFSVGKHIAPNLVFSIERSLTDASNGLKLTWQLTRQFSIIGRAGSDTAIDGQYTFSFD